MEPDAVVRTLRELEAEKSNDVLLFQALARRFHANAEEFFPPQIDAVVDAFAELRYADESLLRGLAGRLSDVAADASPRRVVRLVRNGFKLQLPPEAWFGGLLPQLRHHLPNYRDGIPALLESLHSGRYKEPELVELLLTQGLIVAEELGDSYFTRLFERWSRHSYAHSEAEGRALKLAQLATGADAGQLDIRDNFNLLAGLYRSKSPALEDAKKNLERSLESRLKRGAGGGDMLPALPMGALSPLEEAMVALDWMQRLALRSSRLWRVCADAVELALIEAVFARDRFPSALHALASLSDGREEESALVAALLVAPSSRQAARKHSALQALLLLRAACMLRLVAEKSGAAQSLPELPWAALLGQAVRMSRQLTLPEQRALREAAESLSGLPGALGLRPDIEATRRLVVSPLPPLTGSAEEAAWSVADVGPQAVLLPPDSRGGGAEAPKQGAKLLGFGDTFAGAKQKGGQLTPTCQVAVRALEAQSWQIDLRP